MIHIDKNQGTIRVYAEGKSFENHDSYVASLMFLQMSPATIYIYDAVGRIKGSNYSLFYQALQEDGVKAIFAHLPTKYKPEGFEPLVGTDLHVRKL